MMKHTDVGVAALPPCFVHLHAGRRHPPDAIARLDSWLLHLINCIPFKLKSNGRCHRFAGFLQLTPPELHWLAVKANSSSNLDGAVKAMHIYIYIFIYEYAGTYHVTGKLGGVRVDPHCRVL